ncbi:MAG: thioredoxin family protein [Thalassotalea sp.]
MNAITVFFTAFLLLSCTTNNNDYLNGNVDSSQLFAEDSVFLANYQAFSLTAEEVDLITSLPKATRVEVYFGQWCGDSQREVPRLAKTLSYNPTITVKLIALDLKKDDNLGLAKKVGIKYTPSIIIYHDTNEVKRIIERPKHSWAKDIALALASLPNE